MFDEIEGYSLKAVLLASIMVERIIGAIVSLIAIGLLFDFMFCGCFLPMDAPFFEQLSDALGSIIPLAIHPRSHRIQRQPG